MKECSFKDAVRGVLFGAAIGDALGVPVEFQQRPEIKAKPVTDFRSGGCWGLPAGTFSDDSSLTFCLAEALAEGGELDAVLRNTARHIVDWAHWGYWAVDGEVFDIGNTTREAVFNLERVFDEGGEFEEAGPDSEEAISNGSLMRISPLVFYLRGRPVEERFDITRKISSLTHGHIRVCIACFYYLEFMLRLLDGADKREAYQGLQTEVSGFLRADGVDDAEIGHFDRLLVGDIAALPEWEIRSSGYVIETLEAAVWSFLTTESFHDAALKAVNLGCDTDTTGAVTGGLAGLYYGGTGIPEKWVEGIRMAAAIEGLADRLYHGLTQTPVTPIRYSYEVVPGQLYAGQYPRDRDTRVSQEKLKAILDFGITDFIDLTEEGELEPYTPFLTNCVGHYRFPVQDPCLAPVETMGEIIRKIESLIAAGRKVYLHCWGGTDRTGGVVAAWFVQQGLAPAEAFQAYKARWETNPKAREIQHKPAIQLEPGYLEEFAEYLGESRSTEEITIVEKLGGDPESMLNLQDECN